MANLIPSSDYSNDFDANWFVGAYYSEVEECQEVGQFLPFILTALHDIFKSGKNKYVIKNINNVHINNTNNFHLSKSRQIGAISKIVTVKYVMIFY